MNKQECIKQLEDLKKHCQYQSQDNDPIWNDDVQALDMAIEELKRTAPEVPVQEQLNKKLKKFKCLMLVLSIACAITSLISLSISFKYHNFINYEIDFLNEIKSIIYKY